MKKLSYVLHKEQNTPLYVQLYHQIKRSIYQQELHLGDKLPSKRTLCEYLNISQNTVESAYAQLLAEGYIESKARSGFYVSFQPELSHVVPHEKTQVSTPISPHAYELDFNPNAIDTEHFPLEQWRKAGNYRMKTWLNLGDRQGDFNLRQQIAQYLLASRGVNCAPEQIIIGAGVENCLHPLILLFNQLNPDLRWAMEPYGYPTVEKLLNLHQKKIYKMPFNPEHYPLDFSFLEQNQINIAYLTPSHLYPFGHILPISQRQQLLEWATESRDRYIIEDDYDSEFRYQSKPIPALQSLDRQEKVIYLGSFSKLLMPALRITFLVLPQPLLARYQQVCGFFNASVSRFEQQRLATFIASGEFEKHISRMRKIYRRKMELLTEMLGKYPKHIRFYGEHSGFYLLMEIINDDRSLEQLIALAEQQKIKLYPLAHPAQKCFVMGFGHLSESELKDGITKLFQIWEIEK